MTNGNSMTPAAAARIQSAEAKANGGKVKKNGFAARAQAAAAKHSQENRAGLPSTTGKPSGKGRDNKKPKKK
jgi:hypothetical protein